MPQAIHGSAAAKTVSQNRFLSPRTVFCFPELSSIRTKRSDTDTTPCSSPLPSCSLTDRATDAHRAFKLQGLPLVLMANIASVRKDSCLPVLLPLPAVSEVPGHKQNSRRHPSSITLLLSQRNILELWCKRAIQTPLLISTAGKAQ